MERTNIPQIRFKGFDGAWKENELNELVTINPKTEIPDNFEYVDLESVVDGKIIFHRNVNKQNAPSRAQRVAQKKDFFYQTVRPYQCNNYLFKENDPFVFSTGYAQMRCKNNIIPEFLEFLALSQSFLNLVLIDCAGSSYPAIAPSSLGKIMTFCPKQVSEQTHIASLFTALDKQISIQEQKTEKLRAIKKTLLKKMFAASGENIPQIRFKGFDRAWEENKLNSYLEVSTEKNSLNLYGIYDVLSVSGEVGVVNQIEFQGRSFAGASVSNYGVLRTGEVTYTKSPLKSCPYGIIKANKGDTGIVSVLYGVYKSKGVNTDFVQDYFDLISRLNNYLRPLVNKGAKNTLLISDDDALEGMVKFPKSNSEQTRIAFLFTSLDKQISLQEQKIEKLKAIKKTLLKKMFV